MKQSIINRVTNACKNPLLSRQEVVNEITQCANEVAISRCSHPRFMNVTDRHTSIARRVIVPCGTCYHCLESRTNEWVTRMWHEASHFGDNTHVYFVTLTYAGYRTYEEIPDWLRNAYWRKDTLNSYMKNDYRPCLCRFEHLAYFVRNFRRMMKEKHDDFDFSYVSCCEYGHTWGAPHFHLILYTNRAITTAQLRMAWAYNMATRKKPRWRCLGRIDCVDIKKNGTLVGTKEMNVNRVFSYVAKYMYKMELPKRARLYLFAADLQNGIVTDDSLLDVFDKNTLQKTMFRKQWSEYLAKLNDSLPAVTNDYKKGHFEIRNNINSTKHENNLLSLSLDIEMEKNHILVALRTLSQSDIVRQFRAQVRVSHSHAIGKNYIARNVEKFAQSKLELGKAPFGKLIVPRYYEKVLANYFAPYAEIKNAHCGGASSPLFVRQDKVSLFADYLANGCDPARLSALLHPHFYYERAQTSGELARQKFDRDPFGDISTPAREYDVNDILRSDFSFRDCRVGLRGFIHPCFDGVPRVLWYQYDRSIREYVFVAYDELPDFARFIVNAFNAYSLYKDKLIEKSNENYQYYLLLQEMVCDYFTKDIPCQTYNVVAKSVDVVDGLYTVKVTDQDFVLPTTDEIPLDFEFFIKRAKHEQDEQRKTMQNHYWIEKQCTTKHNRLL